MLNKLSCCETCLSVDLRCFDNSSRDYGVGKFLQNVGFVPDKLFNHETYVDQIHTHSGVIDDEYLEPQWVSQRAIPGAQRWTRRQYKGLIDALHANGVKIYQGAEAAWSYWPEYGTINRCDYIYENLSELFVLHDNGHTSAESRGNINPLRRMKDGTMYEDMLIRDLLRFLDDYEMDGFFAADGFAGLDCSVNHGDFSPDMIAQFEEYTGIEVPKGSLEETVAFLSGERLCDWAKFYSERWENFYKKLCPALEDKGYDLVIFTPWTKGPAESLLTYGIDYGKLYRAGVKCMALEVMEEVIGRRWHGGSALECAGILSAVTAKLQAPGMKIIWTAATANIPEHWHTFRDLPSIIEREALSLFSARVNLPNGQSVKAFDGFLTIFGIDLTHEDWNYFSERVKIGNGFCVECNIGLGLVWSDAVLEEHTKRGETWNIYPVGIQMHYSGVPVQTGCRLDTLQSCGAIRDFLLIDPIGITDGELDVLEQKLKDGCRLVVTGRVESDRLLKMLGLKPSDAAVSGRWRLDNKDGLWLRSISEVEGGYKSSPERYESAGAQVVISDGSICLASRYGNAVYLGAVRDDVPNFDMPKSKAEINCDRPAFERRAEPAITVRMAMKIAADIHPTDIELIEARLVASVIDDLPIPDKGQYYGHRTADGKTVLIIENCMSTLYNVTEVRLRAKKVYVDELPIKRIGPVSYVYWENNADGFTVSVPPDAAVACEVVLE